MKSESTIVACSTAVPAAIAVIRISGSNCAKLLDDCFFAGEKKEHRLLRVGTLVLDSANYEKTNNSAESMDWKDSKNKSNSKKIDNIEIRAIKDKATAIFFKAPKSYTGEDMAEISVHGSAALVKRLLQFLIEKGARAAEKGEFTKRAFLNGKLDLSSAEGVLDLINAESEGELLAAYDEMEGGVRREIEDIQNRISRVVAEVEAAIDFPDEVGGNENGIDQETGQKKNIEPVINDIERLLDSYQSGRLVKNGVRIAVVGGVNVGKSSLLNALLQKERAIVTEIAGTTRDTLEDRYDYKGFKFLITDTAGLRESADVIENMGMQRSLLAAGESDIVLAVTEAGRDFPKEVAEYIEGISAEVIRHENKKNIKNKLIENNNCTNKNSSANHKTENTRCVYNQDGQNKATKKVILIENKTDILLPSRENSIRISAKTGEGIECLKEIILQKAGIESRGETVITSARHFAALTEAKKILESVTDERAEECIAEGLMAAYNELGKITGAIGSDDIINRIFSEFCVGK